jgi:di/tricarboxylate transporter
MLLTLAAFAAFTFELLPVATIGLAIVVLLATGFTLFPFSGPGGALNASHLFLSFGHEALIAICSLMILGRALSVTGALEPAARLLARGWKEHPRLSLLAVLVTCAAASGVINDTPIVVLMIPILIGVANRTGTAVSSMMLPVNYAVLMGGMGTTIGTSTNLLVISIAADLGMRRFAMFEFIHVTALAALPGLLYLWLVAPRLLPQREVAMPQESSKLFDAWLYIDQDSAIAGATLADVLKRAGGQLDVVEIRRGEDLSVVRLPTLTIRPGDRLRVRDTAENLKEFESVLGVRLHRLEDERDGAEKRGNGDETAQLPDQVLASIVVTEESPLLGTSVRRFRFADRYGLIVLGLRRASGKATSQSDEIGDTILGPADILLVQGTEPQLTELKRHGRFLVLDGTLNLPRSAKSRLVVAILAGVVLSAGTGVLPIAVAALTGVAAMLVSRCIDWDDVRSAISSRVVLIVASSLALASALTYTGGTDYVAQQFVGLSRGFGTTATLAALMLLMALFTNFVSNNAAAAIGTPVAIGIAEQLGVGAEPFVLAVMFGANLCYATPMGYQTNLLVMSAGGYRFNDFLRAGVPLTLVMLAALTFLLTVFYPVQ